MDKSTTLAEIQNLEKESKQPCLKYRYIIVILGFFVYSSMSAFRINMSIGIVAMVNNSVGDKDGTPKSDSCPDHPTNNTKDRSSSEPDIYLEQGEFNWSPEIQGYIHSSYFFCHVIAQLPSSKLVERFGFKWILFWGTFSMAVGTLAIPLAANLHFYAVIALQSLRGMGHATYQASFAVLSANWFPKTERGLLYPMILSGSPIGTFLGSIFSGLLCKSIHLGGWATSFYAFGAGGVILSAAVAFFIHESPSVHPKISKVELHYILSNQENALSRRRPKAPWGKILRSVPVYALAIGCFGQAWALTQFQVVHSTFLGTILHYPIEKNGYLSALPFLLMFLFAQVSSWLSSFLTKRNYVSVNQLRKSCNLLACMGYSGCQLGLYFSGCNRMWSNVFSSFSVGFFGIGQSGVWIVPTDMTPTFCASVKSVSCTISLWAGVILPLLVGYLTDGEQTIEQWNKVFFITIGVVMGSGVIFSAFGSADVQPWNYVEEAPKKDVDRETRF